DNFVYGPGLRRVAYNLPMIVATLGPVFVCQGEKNADDVIRRGLIGTTVISNKWDAVTAGTLSGRELFILEDNDEKGRQLAAHAREVLARVAASTRVITMEHLWRHLPPGSRQLDETDDVSDWLAAGGDWRRLVDICQEVPTGGFPALKVYAAP